MKISHFDEWILQAIECALSSILNKFWSNITSVFKKKKKKKKNPDYWFTDWYLMKKGIFRNGENIFVFNFCY